MCYWCDESFVLKVNKLVQECADDLFYDVNLTTPTKEKRYKYVKSFKTETVLF
ncbi:hypothetical protein AGMMS49592_5290 [Endomicrobiia bacterium]|nr:hypothetical protein AGMMS49592_5290 [Endomicrobiia bacterium]